MSHTLQELKKIRHFVSEFYQDKKNIYLLFLILIIQTTLFLLIPGILRKICDSAASCNDYGMLYVWSIGIVFVYMSLFILDIIRGNLTFKAMIECPSLRLREHLIRKLLKTDLVFFYHLDSSKIISIILRSVNEITEQIKNLFETAVMFFHFAAIVTVLLLISVKATSVCLLYSLIFIVPLTVIKKKQLALKSQLYSIYDRLSSHISDLENGYEKIVANRKKHFFKDLLKREIHCIFTENLSKGNRLEEFRRELSFFYIRSSALVLGAIHLYDKVALPLVEIIPFYALFLMMPSADKLFSVKFNVSEIALELDYLTPFVGASEENRGEIEPETFSVQLEEVCLIRENAALLNNISIGIGKPEIIALAGRSGAGKSLICDLIFGFQKASSGAVTVSNIDLSKICLKKYRMMTGYISQNDYLFDRTVRENVTFDPETEFMVIDEALKAVNFKGYRDLDLEDKIDFVNSRLNPSELSGGEKAKILTARLLCKKYSAAIIDEAFASLDVETEKELSDILKQKFQLIIFISHRFSLLQNAERMILLDRGRITYDGDFSDGMHCNAASEMFGEQIC